VTARSPYDVLIAGGGIVGAACAAEFVGARLRVALVEPGIIGGGATAAGMGHLAVMDDSEAQFALTRYSQLLRKELAQRLPSDAEHLPCGAIWVAADDEEMAEVHRKHHFYSERNVSVEIVDARSLAEAEPNLRPGLAGGLLLPDDAVIYPPCVVRFLVMEAQSAGLDLLQGRSVAEACDHGATLDDGSFVPAGATVTQIHALAASRPHGRLEKFSYDPGPLGDEQVEIEVQYCGLCHSDLSMLNNDWQITQFPFVPGHEAIGKVVVFQNARKAGIARDDRGTRMECRKLHVLPFVHDG
jgi:FAD dependent oxidoreductase/Alcohol dehydrogenase GroES-like domain